MSHVKDMVINRVKALQLAFSLIHMCCCSTPLTSELALHWQLPLSWLLYEYKMVNQNMIVIVRDCIEITNLAFLLDLTL